MGRPIRYSPEVRERAVRQVAIKLLTADLTRDETAKQRFLQEAQAALAPRLHLVVDAPSTEVAGDQIRSDEPA